MTGVRTPSRRIRSVLLALLVVVGLVGCEATAEVNVDVAEDGSGTVEVVPVQRAMRSFSTPSWSRTAR